MILDTKIKPPPSPIAVALGFFDGVHRAHQKVLEQTVLSAKADGLIPAVFTFSLDNSSSSEKNKAPLLLEESEKFKKIEEMGIELCYCPNFSDISEYEAEFFVEKLLIEKLKAKKIICGTDHRFGKGAKGNCKLLKAIAEKKGVSCLFLKPVKDGNTAIHSSVIREAILKGDISFADRLLGYPFTINSKVQKGKQLGRLLGAPTINQYFAPGCILPRFGVYSSEIILFGKRYGGITNIGIRPTVTKTNIPIAETHILDFSGDLYGKQIEVKLLRFVRPERKFSSQEELKKQLAFDIKTGRELYLKRQK